LFGSSLKPPVLVARLDSYNSQRAVVGADSVHRAVLCGAW
jgi:hypothetical protein